MHSFFAIIWDAGNRASAEYAAKICDSAKSECPNASDSYSGDGIFVANTSPSQSNSRLIRIQGNKSSKGVVVGNLFQNLSTAEAVRPVDALSRSDSDRICGSDGALLFNNFWGSYVAIVANPDGFSILTDPTSSIPCYFTQHMGVVIVFSHLEQCTFLDFSTFSINYRFLRHILSYDKIQTGETGLNEVSEILGGQRLRVTRGLTSLDTLWDPRDVARVTYEASTDECARVLRDTTMGVVRSWAESMSSVTVSLSGGLDSSIVIGCLSSKATNVDVNAFHHVLESRDTSEERYAKCAAQHAGRHVLSVLTPPARELPQLGAHPLSVRPYRSFIAYDLPTLIEQQKGTLGSSIFSGQGGDHLFLAARSPLGFADFVRQHGLGRGAARSLLEAAKLSNESVWKVLAETFPFALGKRAESYLLKGITGRQTIVNDEIFDAEELRAALPKWVVEPVGTPPGKFRHINSFFHMLRIRETFDHSNGVVFVNPLMSQPLIE